MALNNLIGRGVVLSIRETSATLKGPLAKSTPKAFVLAGTVVPVPTWENGESFVALEVPRSEIALRLIHRSLIQTVNGKKFLQPANRARKWKVRSSKGDTEYTVKENNSRWSCSCVANSNFNKVCKHIKKIQHDHPA